MKFKIIGAILVIAIVIISVVIGKVVRNSSQPPVEGEVVTEQVQQ